MARMEATQRTGRMGDFRANQKGTKMTKLRSLKNVFQAFLDQGRQLELALVFELMSEEQVATLTPENRKIAESLRGTFKRDYLGWHGNTSTLMRQLAPEMYEEFVSYFLVNPKRRALEPVTQQLREWFGGRASSFHQYSGKKFFNGAAIISAFFSHQLLILEAFILKIEGSGTATEASGSSPFANSAGMAMNVGSSGRW